MQTMKKWIKIAVIIAAIALMGAVTAEGFVIKSKSAEIKTLTVQTSQQAELIKKLSEMEAVSLNIRFEVKNTAVFGAIKNGDYQPILEGSLRYLRNELIKQDTFAVSKTVFR
jgi:hypothetical protein